MKMTWAILAARSVDSGKQQEIVIYYVIKPELCYMATSIECFSNVITRSNFQKDKTSKLHVIW